MLKHFTTRLLLALLGLTLSLPLAASSAQRDSFQKRTMDAARVTRNMEYNRLKDLLIQTQAMIDALYIQLEMAPKGELEKLLLTARDEFHLTRSERSGLETALEFAGKYLAMEYEIMELEATAKTNAMSLEIKRKISELEKNSKALRVKGQKSMKSFHKNLKSEELQNIRNWLTISEGMLIRQQEQIALARAAPLTSAAKVSEKAEAQQSVSGNAKTDKP